MAMVDFSEEKEKFIDEKIIISDINKINIVR